MKAIDEVHEAQRPSSNSSLGHSGRRSTETVETDIELIPNPKNRQGRRSVIDLLTKNGSNHTQKTILDDLPRLYKDETS